MLLEAWITITVLGVVVAFMTVTDAIDVIIGGVASLILGSLCAYGALGLEEVGGGQVRAVATPELSIVGLAIIIVGVVYLFDGVIGSLDLGTLRGSR